MTAATQDGALWRFLPGRTLTIKVMGGMFLLLFWQFSVAAFAPAFVAKPLNVALVMPDVLADPDFQAATWSTLSAVIKGLLIALVAGTAVGFAMGRVKAVDRALGFYINGFYTMPMVAVLPLLTIWFGYDENARMATIIFASFFSIVINARDGAKSVPPGYLEVAQACRAKRRHIWFDITFFSSLPYLVAGVRLASGRALVGAVIAEFFVSLEGLGMYILAHTRSFAHNEAVVGVLMLALFGLGFEATLNWVMRRFLPWFRRDVKEGGL